MDDITKQSEQFDADRAEPRDTTRTAQADQ